MRIHTTATWEQMREAMTVAGVQPVNLVKHLSRKAAHAWEVILTGSSRRMAQGGGHRAATWDEWGAFLAAIYRADPAAVCGTAYVNADHFHWSTIDRYATPRAADQAVASRCDHRWDYAGTVATQTYSVHQCRKCTAGRRFLIGGHTWADISGDYVRAVEPAMPTRTLAEVQASVEALRAELDGRDGEYPRPSAPEYGRTYAVEPTDTGIVLDTPTALPWSPSRRRDVVSA